MKRALLAALALVAMLGFLALGIWQVERRAWKLDLMEKVETRVHAPPASLPRATTWAGMDVRSEEYRRVRARGTFRHDRETLVQALTERGAGFWVLTPLSTAEGIVLVNRGFVPPEKRDPATRPVAQTGEVWVTGLLRASEPKGAFLRANEPAANRWYSRDVAAIAEARGLTGAAPFFIDADGAADPGAYPVGGLTVIRFSNNHLVYAITWFALAAMCAFALFLLFRKKRAA